jgi:hypothetical protein
MITEKTGNELMILLFKLFYGLPTVALAQVGLNCFIVQLLITDYCFTATATAYY